MFLDRRVNQLSYKSLGYDAFGIRTIATTDRQTPQETRNSAQPGAVIADGVFVSSGDLKIDKEGIYLGTSVPTHLEGRIYYNWTTHKLMVATQSGFETVTSS